MKRTYRYEEAMAVLRQETVDTSTHQSTKVRVLASIQMRHERHRPWAIAATLVISLLTISTAWAASTGQLQEWGTRLSALVAEPSASNTSQPAPHKEVSRRRVSASLEVPAPPVTNAPTAVMQDAGRAEVVVAAVEKPQFSADALFARATELHFHQRQYDKALPLWEQYLRRWPRGEFALEARFARATALLRVGQVTKAKHELQPFADGHYAGYRQKDAQRLLQWIASQPSAEH